MRRRTSRCYNFSDQGRKFGSPAIKIISKLSKKRPDWVRTKELVVSKSTSSNLSILRTINSVSTSTITVCS